MTCNLIRLLVLGVLLPAAAFAGQLQAGIAAASAAVPKPVLQAGVTPPDVVKDWTLMVFMSGRNDLGQFTEQDINNLEQAGSGAGVNVAVQVATINGGPGATRYHVMRDTFPNRVSSIPSHVPNVDMGSKTAVADFVKWSVKNFPAKKYALVIWGHGFGWAENNYRSGDRKGAISSDSTTGSSLSSKELASVMASTAKALGGRPLDMLVTDSCGMQMLSVVAELRKTVRLVIGSEDQVPADFGFPYGAIVRQLQANPAMTPAELSKLMAEQYRESHPDHVGVSVVDTSKVDGLIDKLNAWLDAVVALDKHSGVSDSITTLPGFYDYARAQDLTANPMSKDIFLLVEGVTESLRRAKQASPALLSAAAELMEFHSQVIVANSQGDLTGLSEYVPKELYNSAYDETRLSKVSKWDDFLKWLLDPEYEYPKDLVPENLSKKRGR